MPEQDFFEHEFQQLLPFSQDQAEGIFLRIAELTRAQGTEISDALTFGSVPIALPEEITEYLPTANGEYRGAQGLYIVQELDRLTGTPVTDGQLANIAFSQSERLNEDAALKTTVDYHIASTPDGGYQLERHVKTLLIGKQVEEDIRYTIQSLHYDDIFQQTTTFDQQKAELSPFKLNTDEAWKLENSLGFYAVSSSEAQSISDTLDLFL